MSRMSSIIRMSPIFQIPKCSFKRKTAPEDQEEPKKEWDYRFRKFAFNWSGYNKYGLYSCDVIDDAIPVVKEVLRRLPKNVKDARNFRLIRATQLDYLKIFLPKEKWITYEQDLEYRYLWPYITEVVSERTEIHEFGCVNYDDDDWPSGAVN